MTPPAVELVSTGSELLSGRTINRHAHVLGECLRGLGLTLSRDTTVGDRAEEIRDAVAGALTRAPVVLVTGGLGPTPDDITCDVVAGLAGAQVIEDAATRAVIEERLTRAGRTVTPQALRQARVVAGAEVLPNPVGAAPGQRRALGEGTVLLLPGPPDEFRAILEESVLPWLAERFAAVTPRAGAVFMVCGIGESDVQRRLEGLGWPACVETTYRAAPARVELGLTVPEGMDAALREAVSDTRRVLGDHIYAEDRVELESVIGDLLRARGETLATAESCTAGLLGGRITSIAGASGFYRGGVIAYANDVKTSLLGVSPEVLETEGAVSASVAQAMAEGVRDRLGADYGVGITGVAGPGGGTDAKPVGLVYLGLAGPQGSRAYEHRFPGRRDWIRTWSVVRSMDWLRRWLQGVEGP